MTSMLKDLKDTLVSKLGGQRYHNNLLGESLADLLRKATAKVLVEPDEELNQQVVDTVHQEIASGKDSKEIASLLKKRLRTDNPLKQWLAVLLIGKVMRDCSGDLGLHQEELLQEVARVMARPAKPDSEAGKRSKAAAKELLRTYGRAAASAFRAVQREGRPQTGPAAVSAATAGLPPEYAAAYAAQLAGNLPPEFGVTGPGAFGSPTEAESVVAEVTQLIDQAKANTELLSDMLVNTDGVDLSDDFENMLIKDLVTEVRELRDLFHAYLEQMQSMNGPEIEILVVQALEATDMLDGALTLQAEVMQNLKDTPAKSPGQTADLIALDDLAESMIAVSVVGPAAPPSAAYDPFSASTSFQPLPETPAAQSVAPPLYPNYGAPAAAFYQAPQAQMQHQSYGTPQQNQYPQQQQQQQQQPLYPPVSSGPAAPYQLATSLSANNPFSTGAPLGGPVPATHPPMAGPMGAATTSQPAAAAATGAPTSVDAEWEMFFAGSYRMSRAE